MSQEYHPSNSSSGGEGSSSRRKDDAYTEEYPFPSGIPQYMTVGNGTTSAAAEALMASLNQDSGYGGSIAGDNADGDIQDWRAGLLEDRPTPAHTPTHPGEYSLAGMLSDIWNQDNVVSANRHTM
jgi:mitofusin